MGVDTNFINDHCRGIERNDYRKLFLITFVVAGFSDSLPVEAKKLESFRWKLEVFPKKLEF